MFNTFEQMVQLYNLAYNQLLLTQLNAAEQEEPLDLSLPKESAGNSGRSDQCYYQPSEHRSSSCSKSPSPSGSPIANESLNLTVRSTDSPPPTDSGSDDSIANYTPNLAEIACALRTGKPLLWHFLYHLLENSRYTSIISWIDREAGHFQIIQPNILAQIWGKCKANPNMTYECLSRSLRSYYQKGIIAKKSRLQYQFSAEALASLKRYDFASAQQ